MKQFSYVKEKARQCHPTYLALCKQWVRVRNFYQHHDMLHLRSPFMNIYYFIWNLKGLAPKFCWLPPCLWNENYQRVRLFAPILRILLVKGERGDAIL